MTRPVPIVAHLAWRNVIRRPGQALLLLFTLTIATGTLSVGMWLYGSADAPWDRVWDATNGFHVSVNYYRDRDAPREDIELAELRREVAALTREQGVVAVGGPWTHLYGSLEVGGTTEDLTAEIRDPVVPAAVDQPLVTAGRWLGQDDGVVVEDGLADTIGLEPGDTVTIQGRTFPVRGTAMTVSRGRFPLSRPAQVWVTPRTAARMRSLGMTEEGFELQLRLADPGDASAFVANHRSLELTNEGETLFLETWQQRRADSHSDIDILAGTLFATGVLISFLTVATAAVLVTGRMAAQTRQIGTLKAVGVTPRQVVLVLLAEHLGLAALATLIGLGIGRILAPRFAATSVTVLGTPEFPPLSPSRAGIVGAVAAVIVLLATIRPAIRGVRHSTLRSLASGARPPRRPGRLARLAERVGVPVVGVLGLRSAWRRPSRLFTNAAGLALGVAMIVVAFGLRASLDLLAVESVEPGHALSAAGIDVLYEQVRAIVLGTAALLIALGTINAFIVAAFAVRDGSRNHAIVRAVGGTPRQTVAALIVSQLGACVLAVGLGIPLGLGLWGLLDGGDLPPVDISALSLTLLAICVPVGFAAIVAVPARRSARRPVSTQLAYE